MSEKAIRIKLVETARELRCTRFVHQGRTKYGLDCLGLVIYAGKQLGYNLEPGVLNYSVNPRDNLFKGVLLREHMLEKISKEESEPGDLMLMNFIGYPMHIAIISENGMIHAHAGATWVTEHALNYKWERRIHSYWRIIWNNVEKI